MKEQVSWNLYDLVDEATPGVMEVSLKDIEQADDLDRSLYTRTLRTGNKRFVARVYGEGVFERSQPHSLAVFNAGFMTLQQYADADQSATGTLESNLPDNVPAPSKYNSKQPDSIFIISR